MPYTDKQQDNILFRRNEDLKRKGKKLSFFARVSIFWFYTKKILLTFFISFGIALAIIGACVGFSEWCKEHLGLGTVFLVGLCIWTLLLIKAFWWDRQKWEVIGKPEYERKTGKGDFGDYFICRGCKKNFNKKLETEKSLCQKCFIKEN